MEEAPQRLKYICNDILKPFRVRILCYDECAQEMHEIARYPPRPSTKGEIFEAASWKVRDKELSVHDIRVDIKYGIPLSMQDELEDNQEDYRSLTHKYWCDLLYNIEVKYNRKRAVSKIKKIATSIASSHSDRY